MPVAEANIEDDGGNEDGEANEENGDAEGNVNDEAPAEADRNGDVELDSMPELENSEHYN